jgi:VWFA-related protein
MQARTGMTVAATLFLCGGAWLSAQVIRTDQVPSFRSGVEVVTLEVGVVDRQGVPVRGLVAGDFTVTVAGQPRPVVTAEFIDTAASVQANVTALPDAASISTNEGVGVGRMFMFVVDQGTLDVGGARQVARSSSRFFGGLTFSDRSALALLPVGPSVQFTSAHARVREAFERVIGMGNTRSTWESGSLAEARDISSTGSMALRLLAQRECGNSINAGGAGAGGGGVSAAGAGSGGAPAPSPGGTQGGETGGGGGSTPAGGAAGGGGGGQSGGTAPRGTNSLSAGGFGMNSCARDLQMQAESAWRVAQMSSLASISSLRQTLAALADVRGDKTVILISGGWPLDERDETTLMQTVATEAAAARATIFTIFVPTFNFSADRRGISNTGFRDQQILASPLETLASMTGGGTFRAEVNADAAFERLRRELGGYYRIGVERDPGDAMPRTGGCGSRWREAA